MNYCNIFSLSTLYTNPHVSKHTPHNNKNNNNSILIKRYQYNTTIGENLVFVRAHARVCVLLQITLITRLK